MSKQTMVMVLSEHSEIAWNHITGNTECADCEAVLCAKTEEMDHQEWRLREHQADMMLDAGLGLTRPAETDAWEEGFRKGYDHRATIATTDGRFPDRPENPYLEG